MSSLDLSVLGLPLDTSDPTTALVVESGLEWIALNTTLQIESLEDVPVNAKLFLMKYAELMSANGLVTSESLGGMSQSFADGTVHATLLRQYAADLLGKWYKAASFTPSARRWS